MLRFYNNLGRKVQPFRPIKAGQVRMYTCGPTVWNYAHIGNFRTFVFEDILRRYLKFKGFKVTQVMNITDVEDRIIRGIKESGKPLKELTSLYESAFKEDLATLGVEKVEAYPRATEHIPEMVALIKSLMTKGYAYVVQDGSVYFEVSKFKRYGALSGVKSGSGRAGGRVAQDHYEEKKVAVDFALWKSWDNADGEVFWVTDLGKGRPGWHIECSAMSMKYLGESFDIHTGGIDNKFPHHENEIAQSEGSTGKKFVRYWLHSGPLTNLGEEMHKSIGNVVYLRSLLDKGWDPLTIRLFLVSARYRDSLDLTEEALSQSKARRDRLQDFILRLRSVHGPARGSERVSRELLENFETAMDDDLNSAAAFGVVFSFIKKVNGLIDSDKLGGAEAERVLGSLAKVNEVLGVMDFGESVLPAKVKELLEQREEARRRKDYAQSDKIRAQLLEKGILVEDTPTGTRWKRVMSG